MPDPKLDNGLRKIRDGMRRASEGFHIADEGFLLALDGIGEAIDGRQSLEGQITELRETIQALQQLVLDQRKR